MIIEDSIYERCLEFAHKRIEGSSNLYAYRGEHNKDKMIEDCLIGTLGEWGSHAYLASKGIKVSEPDLNIYETKKKTFAADLSNSELSIHVKSQSLKSFKRYGASWLLQRTDRVVKEPSDKDHFIFVKVDGREVTIMGTCRVRDIATNNLWGECKVPSYRHSKVALYLDQLGSIDLEVL